MTFQAVIILTCNFWFVFVFFLACEQALQLWRAKRTWRERASEGRRPLALESLLAGYFFSLPLCYCTSWGRRFSSSFLALEARVAKMKRKKRAAEREKVSIVCQGRKPFKSRTTRLHRQTSLFFVI